MARGAPSHASVGAFDQLRAGLGEHLDGHVVRDQVLLDDLADEIEVGLAGRREADLDLLVAHPDQQLEHAALAGRAHRVDQRLVAVAQVDRAPLRRRADPGAGPGAVGQRYRLHQLVERAVAVERQLRATLAVPGGLGVGHGPVRGAQPAGGGGEDGGEGVGRGGHGGVLLGAGDGDPDRRTPNARDEGPVGQTPPRRRRSRRTTLPRVTCAPIHARPGPPVAPSRGRHDPADRVILDRPRAAVRRAGRPERRASRTLVECGIPRARVPTRWPAC